MRKKTGRHRESQISPITHSNVTVPAHRIGGWFLGELREPESGSMSSLGLVEPQK